MRITVGPGSARPPSARSRSPSPTARPSGSRTACRPSGGVEHDVAAVVLDGGAERAERVEVRIEPPAADHVAARRRHPGAARSGPAAGRRAGTRPGSARRARGRPRSCRRSRRRSGPRRGPSHSTRAPSCASSSDHRLDVADPGHVAQDHFVVGQQARGQDRQRAVLVAGGRDRARQRHSAFDYELLHRWPERTVLASPDPCSGGEPVRRDRGPALRASVIRACSARVSAMQVRFRARRPGPSFVNGPSPTRCDATCSPSRRRCGPTRRGSTATSSCGA